MSITQIQNKLYNYNFKSEEIRLNIYLAIHASVLKNKEVPRAYVLSSNSEASLIKNVNDLYMSNCSKIVEDTNAHLSSINISTNSLNSLDFNEKLELIQIIESILENGWGMGIVYYENMRLTPFSNCNFIDILKKTRIYNPDLSNLINILNKRNDYANEFKTSLDTVFSPGNRRYHPSVLSKSYEMLLERNWRNSWMHHSNYLNSENFTDKILIVKDVV
jgi:hypothetical protein